MKFAEHLSAHITPEWRTQYIQYEQMKDQLYEVIDLAPSAEDNDASVVQRYYARFFEEFFQFCEKELTKINTFFSEKLAEAQRKFASLKAELDTAKTIETKKTFPRLRKVKGVLSKDKERKIVTLHARKIHDIKLAFSEFYLSLILLQNYQTLNFTGFRKILKKHDKLLETERGVEWRISQVETAPFYASKQVEKLIGDVETLFTNDLEGGNRTRAMKRLRVPPLGEKENIWTTFRVGFFTGIILVMIVVAVLGCIYVDHKDDWKNAIRLFRPAFLLIIFMSLIGVNTYGWRSSGVNHVLIFELDPRNNLSHQDFLEIAGLFAVIWSGCLLVYIFGPKFLPSSDLMYVSPLVLTGLMLLFLINPFPILHYRARFWLLKYLWRNISAPFYHVGFADFWLADQLNSLATVLQDYEYLVCFYLVEVSWWGREETPICLSPIYGIRPIIAALPAWIRFAQCLRRYRDTKLIFPHIVNAGKYSTTFFVVIFSSLNDWYTREHPNEKMSNAFFYLWIFCAFISSCYTLTWDIRMDWGLLDKNAGENRFLREEVVYRYKAYYYFGMLEDFILRFMWTITVSIGESDIFHDEVLITIISILEVHRRFVWNFFRLENEHLNNCGQFRAVRDISIVPIDASDQTLLENMMDEVDGVTNRHRSRKKKLKKESKLWLLEDDEDESQETWIRGPLSKWLTGGRI